MYQRLLAGAATIQNSTNIVQVISITQKSLSRLFNLSQVVTQ